jgi:hypothetical protein
MSDLRFVYGLHALFHKLSLQLVYVVLPGVPNGIRTRVAGLKGRRPRPG